MIISLLVLIAQGQPGSITLTFTGRVNTTYAQLDSIKVINRMLGCDTMLYWNDTVLSIYFVSLAELPHKADQFNVYQQVPDPITGQTTISIQVPERDKVILSCTDMMGRIFLHTEKVLDAGVHVFHFLPGEHKYTLITAKWRGKQKSIKIPGAVASTNTLVSLEYQGSGVASPPLKSLASTHGFVFNPGDELIYTGYAYGAQSGIRDIPATSKSYTFQFSTNGPCTGLPTVQYEGKVYNTLQVYSQCWLRENLNVGTMISGSEEQTNNGIIEKHCLQDSEDSCTKYGGYYQWDEMMNYTHQPGAKGICPTGWHVPDDEDWKILEGAVDSQFHIGSPEWDGISYRGFDAGNNLKSTTGWYANGNGSDAFGFNGFPCGYTFPSSPYFWKTGREAYWWTSTEINEYAWNRLISYDHDKIHRLNFYKFYGFNIRCLKN